jgi:hypothetical protein
MSNCSQKVSHKILFLDLSTANTQIVVDMLLLFLINNLMFLKHVCDRHKTGECDKVSILILCRGWGV